MKTEISYLLTLLDEYGIEYADSFEKNITEFSDIFLETSKSLNLTAIKEPHDAVIKHYFDSLYPKKYIKSGSKIIDIGCGGGFPSIPLKLADPSLDFTLVDSLKKRLTFLDGVIDTLNLEKITTYHTRAEEASRKPEYRDSYDVAVSRAVASLPLLCELCLPFVKKDGLFLAYKGINDQEIEDAKSAIQKLSAKIEDIITYTLPEDAGTRNLIIIRKTAPTHPMYPRTSKQMSKSVIK